MASSNQKTLKVTILHHDVDEICEAFESFGLHTYAFDTGCSDKRGEYITLVISDKPITEEEAEKFADD